MRLTVAIPTYNRHEALHSLLEHLLPQMTDECRLLILDNHSEIPVEDSLKDLLERFPRRQRRVIRHCVNLGAAANVLRCFELCDTEWLWLLGDDDLPAPDAIATILRHVADRPDCTSFHFTSERYNRRETFVAHGLRELAFRLDSWSHFLFMSVGVYHCASVQPYLRYGYYLAYSLSPHIALLFVALANGGSCCFAKESVIAHEAAAEWPAIQALLGKMILLDLPMEDDIRRELARKLRTSSGIEVMTIMLVQQAQASGDWRLATYQYDQICSRVYYHDRSWLTRLRIPAYRLLIRFPQLGLPLLRSTFPLLKRIAGYGHAAFPTNPPPPMFQRL